MIPKLKFIHTIVNHDAIETLIAQPYPLFLAPWLISTTRFLVSNMMNNCVLTMYLVGAHTISLRDVGSDKLIKSCHGGAKLGNAMIYYGKGEIKHRH